MAGGMSPRDPYRYLLVDLVGDVAVAAVVIVLAAVVVRLVSP